MTTWATVTTVKDRADVVLAFVAHHLEAGASEVWVCFDDPADPARALIADVPGVHALACDDAHWRARRPRSHRQRQWRNANLAKSRSQADWIGHIDIDEFVHADLRFADVLGTLPAEIDVLRLRPVERIFTTLPPRGAISFESRFKRPFPRQGGLDRAVFGPLADSLRRGFMGHLQGKCFCRTQAPDREFRLHDVLGPDRAAVAAFDSLPAARLLHYYPFGYEAWIEKFRRRLDDPAYLASIPARDQNKFRLLQTAHAAGGEEGAWALFHQLCHFGPDRLRLLAGADCLLDLDLDLAAAAARVFGPARTRAAEQAAQAVA